MYSITVIATAPVAKSAARVQNTLSNTLYRSSDTIKYMAHRPMPYNGTHGPVQKPGFIHLRSGFADEKNRRKMSSITQPDMEPIKNRNASING